MSAAAMALARSRFEPEEDPKWGRSTCLALAQQSCTSCHGSGQRISRIFRRTGPCNCVLRAIFRLCFERYQKLSGEERYLSQVKYVRIGDTSGYVHHARNGEGRQTGGHARGTVKGRPNEEFLADFHLVARRTLSEQEQQLLRLHIFGGMEWYRCAAKVGVGRGKFFHMLYRVEQKLGRVFRELEPYALFPLDEYFHGPSKLQGPPR